MGNSNKRAKDFTICICLSVKQRCKLKLENFSLECTKKDNGRINNIIEKSRTKILTRERESLLSLRN